MKTRLGLVSLGVSRSRNTINRELIPARVRDVLPLLRTTFCLVLTAELLCGSFAVRSKVAAQNSKRAGSRAANKRTTQPDSKGNQTLKICQGVAIPPGYVITAYLTSSTCPHGMYILKKQDQYSESLEVAKNAAPRASDSSPAGSSSAPMSTASATNPDPTTLVPSSQKTPAGWSRSVAGVTPLSQPSDTSAQPAGPAARTTTSAGSTDSRPRRVATSQPADQLEATSDDDSTRPVRPPTWAGTAPVNSRDDAATGTVSDPGPEEVSEGDVVRVETNLVTVPVSVLDKQGRFIPDLKRDNFKVFENGLEQSIAYFEPADKPFTVALLLDTSPSTQFHIWEIKEAAIAFAKQLRPQDRVLVVSFNDQVLLLTEVTNDLNVISSVIAQNANMGTATRLYDALDLVIKERLNKIKGRKAIVLFTDGVDTASYLATYESNMREVEELDALIYPIQYDTSDYMRAMQGQGSVTVTTSSSNWPFGTSTSRVTYGTPANMGQPLPGTTKADYDRADQFLHELADKTAGRLYQANDTAQLAQAFSRIAEELRRQYSLGYYPQNGSADSSGRRQIKVRVDRPNLAVRARDSYLRATPPADDVNNKQ